MVMPLPKRRSIVRYIVMDLRNPTTRAILLIAVVAIGSFLVYAGVNGAVWLGSRWFTPSSDGGEMTWWLTNFFGVRAQECYTYFAIGAWVASAVCEGVGIVLVAHCGCGFTKIRIAGIGLMLFGTFLALEGFNTFDWMVGGLGGQPGKVNYFALWNFYLPTVKINGWLFYAGACLVPSYIGAFMASLGISRYVSTR
ncbi:Uncharacterised protein [uncultured archaeon]|nr:Uncharacterised protein [uncultured archaeon]